MLNLVALGLMVSGKKIFKYFSLLLPGKPVFEGIKFFKKKKKKSKEDHGRVVSVKFQESWMGDFR